VIDIHCHIIPGVDDGVPTVDEAIALIRKEVNGGTEAFIATPHFIDRRDYDRLKNIHELVAQLTQAVTEAGIRVEIYQGGEIYPTMAAVKAYDAGTPMTLAGKQKHMLVDLPMGTLPNDFDLILYELQVRGISPILAHPERNGHFQDKLSHLREYLDRGIACQVNAGSLAGKYGTRAGEVARIILRRRWAHFLSSDAHRAGGSAIMGSARAALKKELDDSYLDIITQGSAEAVIRGDTLPQLPEAPPEPEAKGWLSSIFRKK
jgi:protein-tyrosine phosphatase